MTLTDMSAMTPLMYTSGMADAPEVKPEMPIYEARNALAKILERARYFNGVTFLLNRGKRVGAVVPVELAEAALEAGGPAEAAEILRHHLADKA